MTRCSCEARPEPGEARCGACGGLVAADRQPETITVTQVLLVLSAILAIVGLLLVAAAASIVSSLVTGLTPLDGVVAPAGVVLGVEQSLLSAGVAALLVVVVDAWAFVALGRGRSSARWALTALAVVEGLATAATTIAAGASALGVLILVLIGLLVFDVPILVLLWGPESSRRWLAPPTPATPGAAPALVAAPTPTPVTPAAPRLVALSSTGAFEIPRPRAATEAPIVESSGDPVVDPSAAAPTDVADPEPEDPATDRFALRHLTPVRTGRHSVSESWGDRRNGSSTRA